MSHQICILCKLVKYSESHILRVKLVLYMYLWFTFDWSMILYFNWSIFWESSKRAGEPVDWYFFWKSHWDWCVLMMVFGPENPRPVVSRFFCLKAINHLFCAHRNHTRVVLLLVSKEMSGECREWQSAQLSSSWWVAMSCVMMEISTTRFTSPNFDNN
jgi:hypothetical protein